MLLSQESPLEEGFESERENYFEYQDLWRHLLCPVAPADLVFSENNLKDLHSIIYNDFVQSIMRMIDRLVLQYSTKEQQKTASDAEVVLSNNGIFSLCL